MIILGCNGQLGQSFKKVLAHNSDAKFLSRNELDITNNQDVQSYLNSLPAGSIVINCAAYTAVDKAEEERELSSSINTEAVKHIADGCKKNDHLLIHFSTDYVYSNTENSPSSEDSKISPINWYGETKHLGEKYIVENLKDYLIFRTSWLYSPFSNNFLKTVKRILEEKGEMKVVSDQIGNPTSTVMLAEKVIEILETKIRAPGIYNLSGEGQVSWFEFASVIAKEIDPKFKVHPIKSSEYPTKAKRPSYSAMSKEKVKSTFKVEIPHWDKGIKECLIELS